MTLEQRYEQAAQLYQAGKLSQAEVEFQAVIGGAPQAPEPYYFLGRIYAQTHRLDEAQKMLVKSVSLKPDFAEAWQSLGLLYAQQGLYDRSKDAFGRAIELNPERAQWHFNLGLTLQKLGDDIGAIREFEIAVKQDDSQIRSEAQTNLAYLHLRQAHFHSEHSQSSEALRELEIVRNLMSPSFEYYDLLGDVYLKTKDGRAIEAFRQAAELAEPKAVNRAWEKLRHAMAENGKLDEAVDLFRRKVKEEPLRPLYRILLGSALWDREEYQNALEQYQQAAVLDPTSVRARYLVGFIHHVLGNLPAAKSSLESAHKMDPDFLPANLTLGEILAGEGKWQEALPLLEKVAQTKTEDANVHIKLGQLFLDHGKVDQAQRELEGAARLAPSDKKLHYLLGRLYTALNQQELAKREFSIFSDLEAGEMEERRLKSMPSLVRP